MGKIPLNDLGAQHRGLTNELHAAIDRVIADSRFIGGPDHDAFAAEWADFCGVRRAVPCSSGSDALGLAILGVCGRGDGRREIITVAHTFVATVEVIVALGYRPVLVDVDLDTGLMDVEQAVDAITPNTAAIIPVHLYGQMVAVDELAAAADRHGVAVIEDASQAHGSRWRDTGPGQRCAAATFSFQPSKNLGALGDAGAVVTRDAGLADTMARLADHGRIDKHTHGAVGANARMDNLQAAVLRVKLRHLSSWNTARRLAAGWYDEYLADVPGCRTPVVRDGSHHVYHQYVVRLEQRDEVASALRSDGIACAIHYATPVHEQPAFGFLGLAPDDLPNTHAACREILSLPMHPALSRLQVERVCEVIRSAVSAGALC